MGKKLEQIFTDLSSKTKTKKYKKKNFFNKNILILIIIGLSFYFYYEQLKVIYLEYLKNSNILNLIVSIYNLYFSINCLYKLLFIFILYILF